MEIILAIVVFLACLGSFIAGIYVRDLILRGKEPSVKQLKRDIGIKPKAFISSPAQKAKTEEILKDMPEEESL